MRDCHKERLLSIREAPSEAAIVFEVLGDGEEDVSSVPQHNPTANILLHTRHDVI
jgi:hypothetical protein